MRCTCECTADEDADEFGGGVGDVDVHPASQHHPHLVSQRQRGLPRRRAAAVTLRRPAMTDSTIITTPLAYSP